MTFAMGARQLVVQEALEIYIFVRKNVVLKFSCTHDLVLWVIGLQIDTADEHGRIGGRSRDNDLLSTAFQVSRGPT